MNAAVQRGEGWRRGETEGTRMRDAFSIRRGFSLARILFLGAVPTCRRLIRHVTHRHRSVTLMDIHATNRHESGSAAVRSFTHPVGTTGALYEETCKCNLFFFFL